MELLELGQARIFKDGRAPRAAFDEVLGIEFDPNQRHS